MKASKRGAGLLLIGDSGRPAKKGENGDTYLQHLRQGEMGCEKEDAHS